MATKEIEKRKAAFDSLHIGRFLLDGVQLAIKPPYQLWLVTRGGYAMSVKAMNQSWETLLSAAKATPISNILLYTSRFFPGFQSGDKGELAGPRQLEKEFDDYRNWTEKKLTEVDSKLREQGDILQRLDQGVRDIRIAIHAATKAGFLSNEK